MTVSNVRIIGVMVIMAITLSRSASAAAPSGHYVVTAGTVYDTKSQLTWQRTAPSTTYTWADAKTYCAGVGASLGGTGWRLPTTKELVSIIDHSQTTAPYIDLSAFPSTPSDYFWSSTPLAGFPSYAWAVVFAGGGFPVNDVISSTYYARCVR
jgi:hypothetical protein